MLIKATTLESYKSDSLDGEIEKVKEFYFDDLYWTIRYLVADTGNWLTGRQILLSPYAVSVIEKEHHIAINLTKKQIENSPSLNSDMPVSRQFEMDYYGYYGWPTYWNGSYMWGSAPYMIPDSEKSRKPTQEEKTWDSHLRSTHEVTGYHIEAVDGPIGHVEDFIIDDDTWAIRYLIIDTQNWWPGKRILIAPQWIDRISWNESKVFLNLTCDTIKQSPEYTEGSLTRYNETRLHQHYNRQGYWVDQLVAK